MPAAGRKNGLSSIREPATRGPATTPSAGCAGWRKSNTNFFRCCSDVPEERHPVLARVKTQAIVASTGPPGRSLHATLDERKPRVPRRATSSIASLRRRRCRRGQRGERRRHVRRRAGGRSTNAPLERVERTITSARRPSMQPGLRTPARRTLGERPVLLSRTHRARSLSGCLRTKRSPRQCQVSAGEPAAVGERLVLVPHHSSQDIYHRPQPARIARYWSRCPAVQPENGVKPQLISIAPQEEGRRASSPPRPARQGRIVEGWKGGAGGRSCGAASAGRSCRPRSERRRDVLRASVGKDHARAATPQRGFASLKARSARDAPGSATASRFETSTASRSRSAGRG